MSPRRSRNDGKFDGKNIQTVKQIFAKFLVGDVLLQIAVGGGDDPHIDVQRLHSAQPFELAILQHPQQFRLQFQRQFSDLVQEQRPFVRQFDAPNFLADRPGKRSFLMPEQFALQQARRHGRTIELDESLVVPRTQRMHRARHQFLPRAGLSQ